MKIRKAIIPAAGLETRFDMGNKLRSMKANYEVALDHEEIGEDFKKYLKELAASLD